MSERRQLEAKIFLRSLKDAQACLFQSALSATVLEETRTMTQRVAKETKGKSKEKLAAMQTCDAFKPFQFADYTWSKYFQGVVPVERPEDVAKVSRELEAIEGRLREARDRLA